MKEYLKKLFARSRTDEPTRDDWDNILAILTLAFTQQRDASLYATSKLSKHISGLLNKLITTLDSLHDELDDLIPRACKLDATALAASLRSLEAMSVSSVTSASCANANLTRFLSKSQTFMESLQGGVGNTSESEARSGVSALLEPLAASNTLLMEMLSLFTGAMSSYAGSSFSAVGVDKALERGKRYIETVGASTADDLREILSNLAAIRTTLEREMSPIFPQEVIYTGTGISYDLGATDEGDPAEATSTLSGPYTYAAPATLDITADGVGPHTLNLIEAERAFLQTNEAALIVPNPGTPAWKLGNEGAGPHQYTKMRFKASVNGATGLWVETPLIKDMAFDDWVQIENNGTGVDGLKETWGTPPLPIVATVTGASNEILDVRTTRYGEDAVIEIVSPCEVWDNIAGAWVPFDDAGPPAWPAWADPLNIIAYPQDVAILGAWRQTRQIVEETKDQSPLNPSMEKTEIAGGSYGVLSAAQQITLRKIDEAGADLTVVVGSPILTSAIYNFEAVGVEAGDMININGAEELTIASVDGQTATVTTIPVTGAGAYPFTVYPDLSTVAAGYLIDTDYGPFRIAAVGAEGVVTIDTFMQHGYVLPLDTYFSLTKEFYTAHSPTEGTDSSITVGASAAAVNMGLGGANIRGDVYGWEAQTAGAYESLSNQVIRENDKLVCSVTRQIKSAGDRLMLKTPLPNNLSEAFTVRNSDYQAWETLATAVSGWRTANLTLLTRLITTISRMLTAAKIQAITISQVKALVAAASSTLQTLKDSFDAYSIRDLPDAELIFAVLKELKIDRASKLLETCDFSTFFALQQDELTYGDYFAKKARETVRTLANLSRYEDGSYEELIEGTIIHGDSERYGTD